MQTHQYVHRYLALVLCIASMFANMQQALALNHALTRVRHQIATDPQFAVKCAAAVTVIAWQIRSYVMPPVRTKELPPQDLFAQLTLKYKDMPDAFTFVQLAERYLTNNGAAHNLTASRDEVQRDRLALQKVPALAAQAQSLINKLSSLELSMSQEIPTFDLAVHATCYRTYFAPLLQAMGNNALHGRICTQYKHNQMPYPYILCVENISFIRKKIQHYQSKMVNKKHQVYIESQTLREQLKLLRECIVGLPAYHEQCLEHQATQQQQDAHNLQAQQLACSQKQVKLLTALNTNLEKNSSDHAKGLELAAQHLNQFNLLTAQLHTHNIGKDQQQLATERLYANAAHSAEIALSAIKQQKAETAIAQELNKEEHARLSGEVERLKTKVAELERTTSGSEGNSPASDAMCTFSPPPAEAPHELVPGMFPHLEGEQHN